MKKVVKPREPMPIKLLKWCRKEGIYDICAYDNENLDRRWEIDNTENIVSAQGFEFCKCIANGREVVDNLIKPLKELGATDVMGMSAEGALNYALHYMGYSMGASLRSRFIKFLDRYGYKWQCISNCFYLIYKV